MDRSGLTSLRHGWWDSLWGSGRTSRHVRGSEVGVEGGSLSVISTPWHARGRPPGSAPSHHVWMTISWRHLKYIGHE